MREPEATRPKRHWVRLTSPKLGVTIHGEIEVTEDECVIEGTVDSWTQKTGYNFQPEDLAGHSTLHRAVWFEHVYLRNATMPRDDKVPSTLRLLAHDMYSGDFDPRTTPIEKARIPLTDLQPLTIRDSERSRESSYFEEALAEQDGVRVLLTGMFEDNFSLTQQWIAVHMDPAGSHAQARGYLERTVALLCFLTSSTLNTSLIKFHSGSSQAEHWRIGGLKHRPSSWSEWLYRPKAIVDELKRMLPGWLRATNESNIVHQSQVLLGAPGRETLEGLFLTYCQCFEDLNDLRRPNVRLMPEDAFEREVIDVLSPHINKLGNRKLRRRLVDSLRDANRATLETRLKQPFTKSPPWMQQVQERIPDVARDIALRRNQLAHGDSAGAVRRAEEALVVSIQTDVMALYCLAELFFLALRDEDAALEAADKHPRVHHLLYRVGRYEPPCQSDTSSDGDEDE
jgi:hypothetical protein